MVLTEPQFADDYDDRTTAAVNSVLIEMGQILGSFEGKFAIVGGAVPWLLLREADMRHVGTIDVDISLDPSALGDGQYVLLVEALQRQGYRQRQSLRRFQLGRTVPATDSGPDIEVIVDFLMPRDVEIPKNVPPLIPGFAVQPADGADLALRFRQLVTIEGDMPGGGRNRVRIAVASVPALLAMKGYAIDQRLKQKDAYDIYYCIRNFPGGLDALAEATRPLLSSPSARQGYCLIAGKFRKPTDFGPTCVRKFVENSPVLGDRTAEQWQQDAFGQVDAWLRRLGLR